MNLRTLLQRYNTFYTLYQQVKSAHNPHGKSIEQLCKDTILADSSIDKKQRFYYLEMTQGQRVRQSAVCFSYGEAVARKSMHTRRRRTTKGYLLDLEAPTSAVIKEITLEELLEEEWLHALVSRMNHLVPFPEDEIKDMPDDYEIQTLWCFDHHSEAQFLFYDGKEFLYSTHDDATIPSSMDYGHTVVIDEEGNYGIIHNKTKLLTGDPEMVVAFNFGYYYLKDEGILVEVQKKDTPEEINDFRAYLCDIVDIETKKVYSTKALCNSLKYGDKYIEVEDGLLRYVKVDTQEKKVIHKSKPYTYIINYSLDLRPVQDATSKLWGYIDKIGKEVIATQYDDWQFFNDGYTVVPKEAKEIVIDETGKRVITSDYDNIRQYKEGIFFVQKDKKWAALRADEVLVDFLNPDELLDANFMKAHLPRYYPEEAVQEELESYQNLEADHKADYVLQCLLRDNKQALLSKRYTLTLPEYIALFDTFMTQSDLAEAGIWWHPVKVKKLPKHYEDIIKKEETYTIGWNYPASASMFDMTVELPVMFTKVDGSSLGLGIVLEDLELVK